MVTTPELETGNGKLTKIVVIDEDYPSPDNLYGDVFAHARVKEYLKYYNQVYVFASFKSKKEYEYEGVKVICQESYELVRESIHNISPDLILIHFATQPIIVKIIQKVNVPYIIWVHGYEALAWYRRLFNYKSLKSFLYYVRSNVKQLYHFRKLIKQSNKGNPIHFVFVSKWMKAVTEADCFIRVKKYKIIANPIDNHLFKYVRKKESDRSRILMIRPFYSMKYATDLITDAMVELKKSDLFDKFKFTIYGKGSKNSRMNEIFSSCKNVEINEGFLTQKRIKELHDEHGIFLAITRQDAQGVSMCEAMSSGLVVISSNNSAIPEFVANGRSGLLTDNNPVKIAEAIKLLYNDPALFMNISETASREILKKAGIDCIIEKEILLINSMALLQK